MGEMHADVTGRQSPGLARPDRRFHLFDRIADDLFEGFGVGHPRSGRELDAGQPGSVQVAEWLPDVELLEHENELIVRANLHGLSKEDVTVDVTENTVTIEGERKRTHHHGHGGVHQPERGGGRFCRIVSLPEGTPTDQAKATFENGVLEVRMPAPPQAVKHGRRLEIRDIGVPRSPTWEEWGPANEHI